MTTDVDGNKTVVVQDGNVTETINGNQTTAITGNLDVDAEGLIWTNDRKICYFIKR